MFLSLQAETAVVRLMKPRQNESSRPNTALITGKEQIFLINGRRGSNVRGHRYGWRGNLQNTINTLINTNGLYITWETSKNKVIVVHPTFNLHWLLPACWFSVFSFRVLLGLFIKIVHLPCINTHTGTQRVSHRAGLVYRTFSLFSLLCDQEATRERGGGRAHEMWVWIFLTADSTALEWCWILWSRDLFRLCFKSETLLWLNELRINSCSHWL